MKTATETVPFRTLSLVKTDETTDDIRSSATRSLQSGMAAMRELAAALDADLGDAFERAVRTILNAKGRVIVCGVGKSGHIGRKLAATLASTGTPAFFVHPTEASHGDLGMIVPDDVIVALSWSGETAELGDLVSFSGRFSIPLIAVTSKPDSTLGRAADILLALPRVRESCPHDLAPTSSTLIQLALGDALAVALIEQRGFTSAGFKVLHPGGKLAARLKTVQQLMHAGPEIPLVSDGTVMSEALIVIAGRRYGCCGVTDADGRLIGIVTDGDLRRHMGPALLDTPVRTIMTADPVVVERELLASTALGLMNRKRITALFVTEDGRPVGILHVHDLLQAGVA
ncbi:Arabinose 5-phosphate isomerase KdsD [Methylobacterium gnaphalii]|uniref:Capsule expression protein n=2 Tax=Methylobacterium gnaphalii TaxID=1010610 RepID=A0A512JNZ3_9HYPH|nr:capsule expression protein [Methylobacterium gnaphalii]GJD69537.1 Arabinose 5-phosphate isomerase KdsD [Methylobacterium gnaphalii]GLS49075.1 capsule expression protein [Methylobacterium gnaphalii]